MFHIRQDQLRSTGNGPTGGDRISTNQAWTWPRLHHPNEILVVGTAAQDVPQQIHALTTYDLLKTDQVWFQVEDRTTNQASAFRPRRLIIPDIEGITALFIFPYSGLPLHGPLHSFFGALVFGILTGGASYFVLTKVGISETLNKTLSINITLKKSIVSALLGTFSHIMLDAPLYNDMDPFLPFVLHLVQQMPMVK